MCRVDDCEPAEVQTVKRVTARKVHICGECFRSIQPGETYENCFMVFEGDGMTSKVCAHCLVAAQWLTKNCGGYVYSQIREEIAEHAAEYPCLAGPLRALAANMKAKWQSLEGLMPLPVLPPPITVTEA